MSAAIKVDGREYVSVNRASEITKYSRDYIGQLCRGGKIPAIRPGRTWFVDLAALLDYKQIAENNSRANGYKTIGGQIPSPITSPPVAALAPIKWSFIYTSDERPLRPVISKGTTSSATEKRLARKGSRLPGMSSAGYKKLAVALGVIIMVFSGVGLAYAAVFHPKETAVAVDVLARDIARSVVYVDDRLARMSHTAANLTWHDIGSAFDMNAEAGDISPSDDGFRGAEVAVAAAGDTDSVSLADWWRAKRSVAVDVIRNLFGLGSSGGLARTPTTTVTFVYNQPAPTVTGVPVANVPSGGLSSRLSSVETGLLSLTDQLNAFRGTQIAYNNSFTDRVDRNILNSSYVPRPIVISSTGGSGSVTSVDASGGSTGLSFTGGPVTSAGTLTLSGFLDIDNGGTGTSSTPTYGKLLVGNSSGGYDLIATSSLGITGSGTVSSIATNNGLTGGTITTTGTIGLNTAGLSANALTAWDGSNLVATGTQQLTVGHIFATTTATSTLPRIAATGISTAWLCLTGDICRTTWPTAGSSASTTLLADNNTFSGTNVHTGTNTFNALTSLSRASTTQLSLLGQLYDVSNSAGTAGQILMTTNTGTSWVATTTFGTGLTYSGGNVTLNATGDWTGTIDGNNFAGGAVAAGDLLYGASAGSITELSIGASSTVLLSSGTAPRWLTLSPANFSSANISQWTNDSGYLTSLSGAASSTLLADNNTWTGINKFTYASSTALTVSGTFWGASLSNCTTGNKLTWADGAFGCAIDSTGSGSGGGSWSTTTSLVAGQNVNYPNESTDIVAIGSNATTSAEYWFDPNTLTAYLSGGRVGIGTTSPGTILSVAGVANFAGAGSTLYSTLKAPYFTATSSVASVFPYASSTALTVSGNSYLTYASSTFLTSSNGLLAAASSTIGSGTQAGGLTVSGGATTTGDLVLDSADLRLDNNRDIYFKDTAGVYQSIVEFNEFDQVYLKKDATNYFNIGSGFQQYLVGGNFALSAGNDGAVTIGYSTATGVSGLQVAARGRFSSSNVFGIVGNSSQTGDLTRWGNESTAGSAYSILSVVDAQGDFGIGTSSPWGKLAVGTHNGSLTSPSFVIASSSTGVATSTQFIVVNGNVGIGTSTPGTLLSLSGVANFAGAGSTLYSSLTAPYFIATSSTASTFPYASTTMISAATASTTSFFGASLVDCDDSISSKLLWSNTGVFSCGADQAGGGGGTFPFTPTTYGETAANSTSTLIRFDVGLASLASSTIGSGTQAGGLTISGGATTTGNLNVLAGSFYKYNNTNIAFASTTLSNYFFGPAGNLTMTGTNNLGFGLNAARLNSTGASNIGLGTNSLAANDSASNNIAIGTQALFNVVNGGGNIGIGTDALLVNVSGANNTVLGYTAGNASTGSNNLFLGALTAQNLTSGGNNIVIGYNINTPAANSANTLNIGNLLFGTSISGTGSTLSSGNIGIGTTTPYAKLSVVGPVVAEYFHATYTTATSTLAGGLNVGNGSLLYDWSTTQTSISNLAIGALSFDDNAGMVSWADLSVTSSAAAGTVESYTAQIDGNPLLTIYSQSNGSGGIQNSRVSVGTTTPYSRLSVWGAGTGTGQLFALVNNASTTVFQALDNGNVGIGTTSPASTLTVTGSGCFSVGAGSATVACGTTVGNIYYTAANTGNYDVAEKYASSDPTIVAGDIVALDPGNSLKIVKAQSGLRAIGIVSSNPGLILGGADPTAQGTSSKPIALSGRVPVKINLEGGPISIGDPIALSSVSGVGRKAHESGDIVGIALESWSGPSTTVDTIEVFVNLRQHIDLSQFALNADKAIGTTTSPTAGGQSVSSEAILAALQALSSRIEGLESGINSLTDATTTVDIASSTGETLASSTPFISRIAEAVMSLIQSAGEWVVTKISATLAVFNRVEVQTAAVSNGLEMTDQVTGQVYCVTIRNGDFDRRSGSCSSPAAVDPVPTATSTSPVTTTTTPPVTATTPQTSSTTPPVADAQVIPTISSTTPPVAPDTSATSSPTPPVSVSTAPLSEPEPVPEPPEEPGPTGGQETVTSTTL